MATAAPTKAAPTKPAPRHPGPCAADVGLPCRVCERSRAADFRRALATMADPTDCLHRGGPTGALAVCTECAGVRLKVFTCAVHGTCTIDRPGQAVAGKCKGCAERTVMGVPELLPGLADPLPVPALAAAPEGWAQRPAVQARHAEALRRLAATLREMAQPSPPAEGDASAVGLGDACAAQPSPVDRRDASPAAAGDGIIICGGGRYWPMIAMALRMARDVTALPIQVWHRGADEPIERADVADLAGVTFHDATEYACRIAGGWETKGLALVHCGLERVLYLDADAYLVADPRPWLEAATEATPFVFWQDLPQQLGRIRWPAWGMADPRIPPVQGGQLAIHRRGAWRALVLFHWANQHSDYFYHHGFGDQDCWPPALHATGTPWRCLGQAPWQAPAYLLPWDGAPMIVHRCRGKLYGTARDKYEPNLPGEARAWQHRQEYLDGRLPVPTAADWRGRRLRALHREERCDAPGGPGPGNRVAGLLDLIAHVSLVDRGDTSPGPGCDGSPSDETGDENRDGHRPLNRRFALATHADRDTSPTAAGDTTGLRVLEIGSYRGVSSEAFALTCAAVTCVDPWDDQVALTAWHARMDGYPHVRAVRGKSPDALTPTEAGAYDLVYIDAVHAAAELAADIRAAWRVVRPGGWIAGHDYGGPLEEVTATVRRLLGTPRVFADSSWCVPRPATLPEDLP